VTASLIRVGLLVPSSNTMMERDFADNLGERVSLHTGRMYLADTTVQAEERMLDEFVLPAARDLGSARPHIVVFGCTSAGALRGDEFDAELCGRISEITGVPTISTIQAVRRAVRSSGAGAVGVLTPYIEELNDKIRSSLEADAIRVEHIAGMGITDNFSIALVSPEDICQFAATQFAGRAIDLLFVSCTNLAGVASRATLAHRFGVPVVTSNQAVLDAAIEAIDSLVPHG
jgi:maleate isomerase